MSGCSGAIAACHWGLLSRGKVGRSLGGDVLFSLRASHPPGGFGALPARLYLAGCMALSRVRVAGRYSGFMRSYIRSIVMGWRRPLTGLVSYSASLAGVSPILFAGRRRAGEQPGELPACRTACRWAGDV